MAKEQSNYPASKDVLDTDRQAGQVVTSAAFDVIEDAITEIEAEIRRVTTKTTTGTLTSAEGGLISCSSTGGAYTLTLPASTGLPGLAYFFVKTDVSANTITLDGSSGEKINGSLTYTDLDEQWDWVVLRSDTSSTGNHWVILSEGSANYAELNKWAGAVTLSTGGAINLVTFSTSGTVNIPSGQEYQINGAEVKLDEWATPTTGTTLDATTGVHGLLPIRDGDAAHWLDGSGAWSAPTADEVGALYSSGAFTARAIAEISTTGGAIKASPFLVTTGSVMDFGAHSAGFTEQAIATTTGTAAINWSNGIKALFTRSTGAGGAVTFSFTAPPKSVNLQLTIRGSTGGSTETVTWPTVYWQGGSTPTLSTGVSALDVISFYYSTGLTAYLGLGSANFSTV